MNPVDSTPLCKTCGGAGKTLVEGCDNDWKQCVCAFTRSLRTKLGPEISTAKLVTETPLLKGSVDLTKENVLLKADWTLLTGHLKFVLMQKNYEHGLHFYCNILTDERLKTVWVGDEAYKAKSRKKRDGVESHNTLADIVGPNYDLVLIRLGFLGYPNRAMPGILKEALMIRQGAAKPTWLVEDPEFPPFTQGHHAWNQEVGRYVVERFKEVSLLSTEAKFASSYFPETPSKGMVLSDEDAFPPPPWDSKPSYGGSKPSYGHDLDESIVGRSTKPKKRRGTGPV